MNIHFRAVEDCIEIVKQVPYLAPYEKCREEPREECVDVDEEVPIIVCTSIDPRFENI